MRTRLSTGAVHILRHLRQNGGDGYQAMADKVLIKMANLGNFSRVEILRRVWQRLLDDKRIELHDPRAAVPLYVLTLSGHQALSDHERLLTQGKTRAHPYQNQQRDYTAAAPWVQELFRPPAREGALDFLSYPSKGF